VWVSAGLPPLPVSRGRRGTGRAFPLQGERMTATTEQIGRLLHEAGETHHHVFRIVDGADEDWASWYYDWLINLSELPSLLGTKPVRSELTYLLVSRGSGGSSARCPASATEATLARSCLPGSFSTTPTANPAGQAIRALGAGDLAMLRISRAVRAEDSRLRSQAPPVHGRRDATGRVRLAAGPSRRQPGGVLLATGARACRRS